MWIKTVIKKIGHVVKKDAPKVGKKAAEVAGVAAITDVVKKEI